jgi:hypothetical protein
MSNVAINIAAEFTGKKAFKQADGAVSGLTKNVNRLAGVFAAAFSVTAITRYGMASVKAAAQDEAAQKQLALALKNVGLGRNAAASEAYIQKLEKEFGILDDKLRPAYQTLAIATKDSVEAQRLLNLALDISASTTKPLASVTSALSKAYLWNNTALSKLGIGISKADLKAKSFNDITEQLTTTFAGSAKAAVNTFQGSLDKLTVASNNAKETIGKGLIQSLQMLGGEDGVGRTTKAIDELSVALSESLVAATKLVLELKKLPLIGGFLQRVTSNPLSLPKEALVFGKGGLLDYFRDYGKSQGGFPQGLPADLAKLQASMAQSIKKNNTVVTKNTAAVVKLTEKFNIRKAGITAALANPNISTDTANRLRGLLAIENGDAAASIKYGNLVKPNASMANPNATVVNIYPQGNVLTEQDLVTYIQDGLQTQSRRRGGSKFGALTL